MEYPQLINCEKEFTDISYNGRIYEVGLPWKDDCLPSSDNQQMCQKHLKFLHRKLNKHPALLKEHDNFVRDQEEIGIIERVAETCENESNAKAVRIHYSPHHAVVRKD